jgi:deoxyribose-phosphate aldolase
MDNANNENLIAEITAEVLRNLNIRITSSGKTVNGDNEKEAQLRNIAKMIDHTLLKPEATYEQVKQLCDEAMEFGFASVCVNSGNVTMAREFLKGSNIPVCSVVGFPLGAASTRSKVCETKEAIENGATEIDMVINIGALKSKDHGKVMSDIEEVVIAAGKKAIVKVIIETCLLSDEEKIKACELAKEAGAAFVKTSTGFSTGGATVEDIRLMRRVVGPSIGVKASGGVGDYKGAMALLDAGACTLGNNSLCRLGTSKSIKILEG